MLTAAVSGTIVQSQINLAAISALGQPIGLAERWSMSMFDLRSFAPMWSLVLAFAFLLAWPVAGWLARRWPSARGLLFPLAGLCAVVCALLAMDALLPVTVVAAARSLAGMLLLGLCGALGGWVYVRATAQRQKGPN